MQVYDPESEMNDARVSARDAPDLRPTGLVTPNGAPLRFGKPDDPNRKPSFYCEEAMRPHVARVFEGEYEVTMSPELVKPRILDIGANLGAFAIWASKRWPGASFICFEPHPTTYKLLLART